MKKKAHKYRLKFMQDGFVVRMTILAPSLRAVLGFFEKEGLNWRTASIVRVR